MNMMKLEETLELALESLTNDYTNDDEMNAWHIRCQAAITALREQLKALRKRGPAATDWERIARVQDAKLRAMCNEPGGFEKLCEVMDRYERTYPPEQQAAEPVAWRYKKDGGGWFVSDNEPQYVEQWDDIQEIQPLYTHPAPAQQPLTDDRYINAMSALTHLLMVHEGRDHNTAKEIARQMSENGIDQGMT